MLLSVLTSVALAFAPSQTTWIGVEPNRIMEFNRVTQDRLRNQRYWTSLRLRIQLGRRDLMRESGKPYRMWGAGIEFNTTSEPALYGELLPFLEDHELTGLKASQLWHVLVCERTSMQIECMSNLNKWKPCRPPFGMT